MRTTLENLPERHRGKATQAYEASTQVKNVTRQSAKPTHPEQELQKAIITTARKWPLRALAGPEWDQEFRKDMLGDYLHHIPNGGHRSAVEAAIFKAMGVKPGVWDLFLPVPTTRAPGLYLELKAGAGALTDHQVAFRDRQTRLGYTMVEIRALSEFMFAIDKYFEGAAPGYAAARTS